MTLAEKLKQNGCLVEEKSFREKVLEAVEEAYKEYPTLKEHSFYLSRSRGMTPTSTTFPPSEEDEIRRILESEGFSVRVQRNFTRCDQMIISIEA